MAKGICLAALCLVVLVQNIAADNDYSKLYSKLMRDYNSAAIPKPDRRPLELSLKFNPVAISSVDRANNQLTMVVWMHHAWKDQQLRWSDRQFNVSTMVMQANDLWRPDLAVYNQIKPDRVVGPHNVAVMPDGSVVYVPAKEITIGCDMEAIDSYSGASCMIRIGSWAYNANQLRLTETDDADNASSFSLDDFLGSSRYEILRPRASMEVKQYACCPEGYQHMLIKFQLRDKFPGRGAEGAGPVRFRRRQ